MFDEKFWIAISFIIFISLIAKTVCKLISKKTGDVVIAIKNKIDEVQKIKEEAKELKEEFLKKKEINEQKSIDIVVNAKKMAEKTIKEEKERLKDYLKNKEEQNVSLIEKMKNNLLSELRNKAINDAIIKFKEYLSKESLDKQLYQNSLHQLKHILKQN